MNKPLNAIDVLRITKTPYRVLKYRDILQYKTLDDLLGKEGGVILLYEFIHNVGHWFCIFKLDSNTIEHFDSLGYKPDFELSKVKSELRAEFGEMSPYVCKLMRESPYVLTYNEHKLQGKTTATCGRWVGLRLRNRHRTLEEFVYLLNKFIKQNYKKKITKDEAIVELTNIFFMS